MAAFTGPEQTQANKQSSVESGGRGSEKSARKGTVSSPLKSMDHSRSTVLQWMASSTGEHGQYKLNLAGYFK